MTRAFAICLGLLLASSTAEASLTAQASLSETRVYTGEPVTLEVIVVSSADGEVDIDVPPVEGLQELRRGASDSTSISWINGAQSIRRERILRVDYEAVKAGKLTIPPIEARVGNERARTTPLDLEVSGQDRNEALGPGAAPVPGEVAPPTTEEGEIFLRYRVDRAEAFLGEQILVDLEIFTAGSYSLEENRPPPSPDGFWREILDQTSRLEPRAERINGRTYRAYRIWRMALFGLEAGERTIPPVTLTFSANRSIFSSGQRLRRSAPPVRLNILPLPTQGRPRDFATTNVGRYSLDAQVDNTQVPAGKGVVLTVSVFGQGNITNLKLPELKSAEGFRVFPPTFKDAVNRDLNGVSGTKRAEILLVPLRGGRLVVPSIEVPIFDPSKRDYVVLRSEEIPVFVEGDPTADPAPNVVPQPQQPERRDDALAALRPLRFRSDLERGTPSLAGRPEFFALLGAPPLLFVFALFLQAGVQRLRRETPDSKRKKALSRARAELVNAENTLTSAGPLAAFTAVNEVLVSYATVRTGVALRGLTSDQAREELEKKGAPRDLVEALVAEIKRCELARFAPGGGAAEEAKASIHRARELLVALENWAGSKRRPS